MTRSQHALSNRVSRGLRFLVLEFLIVFLGVYLASLFQEYGEDRVNIMSRIAELARLNLETVNAAFPPERLREIELMLIASTARGQDEQQRALLLKLTREAFHDLRDATEQAASGFYDT